MAVHVEVPAVTEQLGAPRLPSPPFAGEPTIANVKFWPLVSLPESVMSLAVSSFVATVWLAAIGAVFATKLPSVQRLPFEGCLAGGR